ncbi:MAG TPA: ABC transporter permease [Solirubrobacteraceae bacterium]|nr:ABC transporter permease [Solirubrobacteraceae bacterium]
MNLDIARQMLSAEILKLRRNRTIMVVAFLLTFGVVAIMFGYGAVQHASSPAQNGPAGGLAGFTHAVKALGVFFGLLAASLIGTEAGTADISSGVFRDLVATGRSRLALFGVRAPAAIIVTVAFSGITFLLSLAVSFLLAGGTPTPSLSMILQSAGWILLANAVVCAFAVGVGSLTGSRGATLVAVIGWQTVATQLLLHIQSLGSARDWLLTAGLGQLMPVPGQIAGITMAAGLAAAVVAAWAIVPTLIGAWRTETTDA